MALHLEHGGVTVAEVDDAGIFPRTLNDLGPFRGQLF